jgi:hypothetical protein
MTCAWISIAALGVLATACAKPDMNAEPKREDAPAVVASDADAALSPSTRLALQKLTGSTSADRAIDEAQAAARQAMAKDDAWIVLGRAWVRKRGFARGPPPRTRRR